ncbi:hypothetical protein ACLK1G_04790 [Pseudomonas sp. NR3]|uniref:hypothetical protein n=1 Tax=Pseudomonas sp. NR3 TaxID=3155978 RepID=UPI003B675AFE
MIEWFSAAVSSANAAKEITQSFLILREEEAIRSRVYELTSSLMELQQQMMNAQVQQMELIRRVAELESDLSQARSQADERAKYVLYKFPQGVYAYTLREDLRDEAPEHYLCSNCFEKGDRVTLQSTSQGWESGYTCPRCAMFIAARRTDI